tara:strand:- start:305 stop:415 length:111 start_codon:yes stop_codon:yes gene_type:complete
MVYSNNYAGKANYQKEQEKEEVYWNTANVSFFSITN